MRGSDVLFEVGIRGKVFAAGVLVVQSVEVPPDSPLRVAVIGHRLLQISTIRTLEGPLFFTYTASNGERSAVGQVVVQPVPAQAGQQPPVVPDVTATVNRGRSTVRMRHDLSARQIALLLKGGVINWLRERNAAAGGAPALVA